MVNVKKDLTGQKFGMLTVIKQAEDYVKPSGARAAQWECKCDCGKTVIVTGGHLVSGTTTSCGCSRIGVNAKDLTGKRFGKLVALEKSNLRDSNGAIKWKCRCDCGNIIYVRSSHLIDGSTTSCGCTHNIQHGLSNTQSRIYNIHNKMLQRCNNPKFGAYPNYGGRGIYICDEWNGTDKFINFYNWAMQNGYTDNLSIDRIDVNGPYAPWNCRWVSSTIQNNNTRVNRIISFNGSNYTAAQCADALNVDKHIMYHTLDRCNNDINLAIKNLHNNNHPTNAIYFVDKYGYPTNIF